MPKSDLLNPEDSFILSGGGDDRALLWDFWNPDVACAELKDFKDSVEFIEFNFDGTLMLVGGTSNPLQIY